MFRGSDVPLETRWGFTCGVLLASAFHRHWFWWTVDLRAFLQQSLCFFILIIVHQSAYIKPRIWRETLQCNVSAICIMRLSTSFMLLETIAGMEKQFSCNSMTFSALHCQISRFCAGSLRCEITVHSLHLCDGEICQATCLKRHLSRNASWVLPGGHGVTLRGYPLKASAGSNATALSNSRRRCM